MKRNLLLKTAAFLLLLFFGCAKEGEEGESGAGLPVGVDVPEVPADDVILLSRGAIPAALPAHTFSFDVLQTILEKEKGKNLLFSPLGAGSPLAMLANGAAGETFDEIRKLLGYEGAPIEELNARFEQLKALASSDEDVKVEQANVVFTDFRFPVLPAFAETMQASYGAEVQEHDFNDAEATLALINAWTSEQTHGLIPQLLDELEGTTYLIHTLYFKALWASPFNPEYTKDETFANADGSFSRVPAMNQSLRAFAYSGESFDALELDYKGNEYSMVMLLPKEGVALSSIEKQLSPASFRQTLSEMYLCDASVRLPKFELGDEHALNDALESMAGGSLKLFGKGDYSLLSPNYSETLIRVVQKTFANVDEEGTEAAAATYVEMLTSTKPEAYPKIDFHVDRPFLFLIHEKSTGEILFAGRILSL